MLDGNDGAHDKEHHQLIEAAHKVVHHIAQDHLPALCHIHQLAAHHPQKDREGNGEQHSQHDAGNAPDLPVGDKDQGDLSGHSPQGHAEVQAHTSHDGDQKTEDQENIPAHAGNDLVQKIAGREPGQGVTDDADDDKHNGDQVVLEEVGALAKQILFHLHFPPSVFLVRA